MDLISRAKRLVLGRAMRSDEQRAGMTRGQALPAFASDALSSNTYATQEVLVILAVGGFSLYQFGPYIAVAVAAVFFLIVAAYRNVVRQYPSGGADYEVAATNLGARPAAVVAAAMLVDFALTLAVSVAAALDNIVSLFPALDEARIPLALLLIALLALLNLRGLGEGSRFFAYSVYVFIAAIAMLAAVAVIRMASGDELRAESADYEVASPSIGLTGLALVLILTRAFSSGSIAVTGVESIGTAVPSFSRPRGQNAASTLVYLGITSMALFATITWLALATGVRVAEEPSQLIGLPEGQPQKTVMVQVSEAVFTNPIPVLLVTVATVLILAAAGNSAYRSFSVLSSILARDGFLPKQLLARGDRLVYSNGILLLTLAAAILVAVLGVQVNDLIQLYIVGVFLALTLGQAGMVRHWSRVMDSSAVPVAERSRARRARWLALLTQFVTGAVLVVELLSKFTRGAWIVVIAIPVLYLMMMAVRRHYQRVTVELAAEDEIKMTLPSQVTALILVSRIHKPTLRAIAYARATRPTTLEAITVAVDKGEAEALVAEWQRRDIPVPLRVLESPYREINRPVIEYVARLRRQSPRHLVSIYVPEYVVAHWWERLLHNQSAARLKRRLLMFPNVVVVSVPWQLVSGESEIMDQGVPPPTGGITGVTGVMPVVNPNRPPPRSR